MVHVGVILHQFAGDDRHHHPFEDVLSHPEEEWPIHHLVGGPLGDRPLADALLRLTDDAVHLSDLLLGELDAAALLDVSALLHRTEEELPPEGVRGHLHPAEHHQDVASVGPHRLVDRFAHGQDLGQLQEGLALPLASAGSQPLTHPRQAQ